MIPDASFGAHAHLSDPRAYATIPIYEKSVRDVAAGGVRPIASGAKASRTHRSGWCRPRRH
ncbi:hypothetical protein SBA5_70045 [Candidatus Sulfotelmatomonas gaucii]|uniref:Uncharacterized protein n=1 Tax=Candidatus Sulfuritelmatomonas gaucii TaxID=2043161 RepID=A0A2N9M0C3_9BACT|nr:hypothetical protein SBA5_70045 [Candidatus Sulfotelmatomonas gaucii]